MSDCLLKRLVLLSHHERKARIVPFHPKATVLTGNNNTGKSSILKSIVRCMGGEPPIHPSWKSASVHLLLTLELAGAEFSILRRGESFSVFDSKGKLTGSFDSVTKGLGPFLAEKLSFGLRLRNQAGSFAIPPPAYFLLPFYFDQDRSWNKAWDSFERLQQMSSWKDDLIEYHTGIRPNKFYELKGKQTDLMSNIEMLQGEMKVVRRIREDLRDQLQSVRFTVDLEVFQKEITELLVECGKMQKVADAVREKLVVLHNERIGLEAQIEIVRASLKELGRDYKFLHDSGEHLDCPTCGAVYENSFAEVFSIAVDEDRCEELLHQLDRRLFEVTEKIRDQDRTHEQYETEIGRIRAILAERKEQVQLKDLIENEGKHQVQVVLQEKVRRLTTFLVADQEAFEKLKQELKALTNKEHRDAINREFRRLMRDALARLAINTLPESSFKTVNAKIKEQGSNLPRALLAYGFSILNVMREFSSSSFFPVILDAPIQQEPDPANHRRILEFIDQSRPSQSQMVVAVGDLRGVDFGGSLIELSDQWSVLQESFYEEAAELIQPYFDQSLLSNHA
jgi:hypothetical protein